MIKLNKHKLHVSFTYLIATVWIVNGLFCKVLNLAPRHEQIVARILGSTYSRPLTIAIGFSEIIMAIWILSKYKSKLNTFVQIAVIILMNIIEFMIVPDLLMWHKANIIFAVLFSSLVYYNGFRLNLK
ncbi:MAG: hypothetical protein ACI86M_002086 [Saprospiraceae bacterium]|jgi:hypothetical protein